MPLNEIVDHRTADGASGAIEGGGEALEPGTIRDGSSGHRALMLIGGFAAITASLLVFGAIAEEIQEQEANTLDGFATPFLHGLANPALDTLMNGLTAMGSTAVVIALFIVAMLLLIWRHHRREAVFLAVAIGGSVIIDQALKLIFHRPRPQLSWSQVQPEYSFPSGHSMNSLVFYLALAIIVGTLLGRRAGVVAVIVAVGLAVLIGASRIYLGYHYFTDVVGGLVAGLAWLLIMSWAFGMGAAPRGPAIPTAGP